MCADVCGGAALCVRLGERERGGGAFRVECEGVVGHNGEVYGRPGMFEATLFTKREGKRTWVYTEDEAEELWDELD